MRSAEANDILTEALALLDLPGSRASDVRNGIRRVKDAINADQVGYMPGADLEILACGSKVMIGMGSDQIVGQVTAATIREGYVTYEVVWWDGRVRREEWLSAVEVVPLPDQATTTLGFHRRGSMNYPGPGR